MTQFEELIPTDLFEEGRRTMPLQPGAMLLGNFAAPDADALLGEISRIEATAPFRNMVTPGGWPMSVAMTNCGSVGWVTDRTGYRYDPLNPATGKPWPAMPETFRSLAECAAEVAGYLEFDPDSCLMNRYEPGSRLSLHQDRNERNFMRRSSPSRLAYQRPSFGVAPPVATSLRAYGSSTVMWLCGADLPGSPSTASIRCEVARALRARYAIILRLGPLGNSKVRRAIS